MGEEEKEKTSKEKETRKVVLLSIPSLSFTFHSFPFSLPISLLRIYRYIHRKRGDREVQRKNWKARQSEAKERMRKGGRGKYERKERRRRVDQSRKKRTGSASQ
jgi:hypothetical protein